MIDVTIQAIVDQLMTRDNADEILKYAIKSYSDATSSYDSMKTIVHMLEPMLDSIESDTRKYQAAAKWSIATQAMDADKDPVGYFAAMVPVVMALFPDGINGEASGASQWYFGTFLGLLADPKVFDFDSKEDMSWAESFKYKEYLIKMKDRYL